MQRLRSLREFIAELEKIGDLQSIDKEVDWNLELGAIARRSYELRAPAPLFTNITGDEDGFRVLAAPGGVSAVPGMTYARVALAFGLPADAKGADIVTALADARNRKPIPPRILPTDPCKETVRRGDQVDLLRFPTPGDGGRYIQTYGLNIVKTPDGRPVRRG